jgi:hypothetical protein
VHLIPLFKIYFKCILKCQKFLNNMSHRHLHNICAHQVNSRKTDFVCDLSKKYKICFQNKDFLRTLLFFYKEHRKLSIFRETLECGYVCKTSDF